MQGSPAPIPASLEVSHRIYRYVTNKSRFLPTKHVLYPQCCLKYRIVLDVLRPEEVVTEVGDQVVIGQGKRGGGQGEKRRKTIDKS